MKFPCNSRTFGLVGLDELLIHFGKGFFGLLDVSDVLGENKNSSLQAVGVPPRTNFPAYPHRTVFTIPAIFVSAQCFSLQSTSVDLVPTVGNVGKKFVVRASKHLRAVDRVIRAKPLADLEIAHVTVEH